MRAGRCGARQRKELELPLAARYYAGRHIAYFAGVPNTGSENSHR